MNSLKYALASCATVALVGMTTLPVTAAEFPTGPIEFVIPFGAGGGADIEGRLLAQEMSSSVLSRFGIALQPEVRIIGEAADD